MSGTNQAETASLPIPLVALEDCGAILGRRGAGKSATKTLLFEHELDRGRRCCLIDPKGDGWGIRLDPDGQPSRFGNVAVFGGDHGDLPIDDAQGRALGAVVAAHDLSCVVDLSALSVAGQRRFMHDFAEALFEGNRAPITLFVDEADQLAPQRLPAEMARLLHQMERLIRQGRQRGIFMWMLTQRPQVLNKNLLSQAETLIAMKMTTPHDRGAIRDWMEAHDPVKAREVEASLSRLAVGEAWVWVPAADFLERVQFPLFSTYDSGRTPRHGEHVEQVSLGRIDLSDVAAALGAAAAHEAPPRAAPLDAAMLVLQRELADILLQARVFERVLRDFVGKAQEMFAHAGSLPAGTLLLGKGGEAGLAPPQRTIVAPGQEHRLPANSAIAGFVAMTARPDLPLSSSANGQAPPLTPSARKLLLAIAMLFPRMVTLEQAAVAAGLSRRSSTFQQNRKALLDGGFIEVDRSGFVRLGHAARNDKDVMAAVNEPNGDIVQFWAGKFTPGVGRMLTFIAEGWRRAPHAYLTKQEIADGAGMSITSSSFAGGLTELRRNGLIEVDHSGLGFVLAEALR